jgi:hypothetical protein
LPWFETICALARVNAEESAIPLEVIHPSGHQVTYRFDWILQPAGALPDESCQFADFFLKQFQVQTLFIPEIQIDSPGRVVSGGRNLLHGSRVKSMRGENRFRRPQNIGASLAAFTLSARPRPSGDE